MGNPVDALLLDLLEFVARGDRSYDEVIEAWRTSCPRLPVWEEANERNLIVRARSGGRTSVRITREGLALLAQAGRLHPAPRAAIPG